MEQLQIEDVKGTTSTAVKKISGFTDEEIYDIEHMDYRDMKKAVIDAINKCNNGIGKDWRVLSMWTRGKLVYAEIDCERERG